MPDGTTEDVFYNGVTIEEMRSGFGLLKLGVEHVKPIITRGVLIDVAAYKGVEVLPNAYEVTVDDVRGALALAGLEESDLRPGDALLFRYGWSAYWEDAAAYNDSPPGIGISVADWIVERQPSMIGSDSWASEVFPNPDPDQLYRTV